jgi:hypothetical protein
MAFLIPEALKTARNPWMMLVAKSVITTDAMSSLIPIEPIAGNGYTYMREGTLPSTEFIAEAGTTTEESSGTDDVIDVRFRRIVGNLDLDQLSDIGGGSSPAEKKTRLLAKKIKTTWRKVQDTMINGGYATGFTVGNATVTPGLAVDAAVPSPHTDSIRGGVGVLRYTHTGTFWAYKAPGDLEFGANVAIAADGSATLYSANESKYVTVTIDVSDATANGTCTIEFTSSTNAFDGLEKLLPSSQIAGTAGTGAAYSLAMLDRLLSLNKIPEGRAIMMNSTLIEKHYAAWRALGGSTPEVTAIAGYTGSVPAYRGVPILQNDFIPSDETDGATNTASSIYCVSLNADNGVYLAASSYGSLESPDADPRVRPVAGFSIEDLGALEGKDAHRTRVKWIGAMALGSKYGASRYQAVLTT